MFKSAIKMYLYRMQLQANMFASYEKTQYPSASERSIDGSNVALSGL